MRENAGICKNMQENTTIYKEYVRILNIMPAQEHGDLCRNIEGYTGIRQIWRDRQVQENHGIRQDVLQFGVGCPLIRGVMSSNSGCESLNSGGAPLIRGPNY